MSGNAYKQLSTMVDAVEKMALLPQNEIIDNKKLVADIRNAFSVHNIDNIINSAQREIQDFKNNQVQNTSNYTDLLNVYARRETERLQDAPGKEYVTQIINANDGVKE